MNYIKKINPKSGDYSKQNFMCVYAIQSIVTGDVYIGSTKHFGIRRRNHIHKLNKNKHHSKILQSHFNKFGIEDLVFLVLEETKDYPSLDREQYYMNLYKPYFNIHKSAYSPAGKIASPETLNKLSNSHMGIIPSKESLEKRSLSMKMKLRSLSKEEKIKRIEGANRALWKRVICNETGGVYESVAQAERETGCDNITRICKSGKGSSKGLTFKYA